ncbi:hypothetical protein AAFG13_35835 [Bradyrhizobium sp. B124]|uniref:hypothetical protein n=1 Tax=Bradyrhizobium sp. B124 TaxID=3140245 RepID=UPI003182BC8A
MKLAEGWYSTQYARASSGFASRRIEHLGEALTPISILTFHAAGQFAINAILDPTDRKKLQSGSGPAADRLTTNLETVAPFAWQRFMNAELYASVLHKFLFTPIAHVVFFGASSVQRRLIYDSSIMRTLT